MRFNDSNQFDLYFVKARNQGRGKGMRRGNFSREMAFLKCFNSIFLNPDGAYRDTDGPTICLMCFC